MASSIPYNVVPAMKPVMLTNEAACDEDTSAV